MTTSYLALPPSTRNRDPDLSPVPPLTFRTPPISVSTPCQPMTVDLSAWGRNRRVMAAFWRRRSGGGRNEHQGCSRKRTRLERLNTVEGDR
jgi:hypothetical protein